MQSRAPRAASGMRRHVATVWVLAGAVGAVGVAWAQAVAAPVAGDAARMTGNAARVTGNAARGEALYAARCFACHSPDAQRVGPAHRGVVGRRAGTAPGYVYSEALATAGFSWTLDALDRWLADPELLVPGQRMGYRVEQAADRADLVAYLATLR